MRLNILLVEDNRVDAMSVRREFASGGFDVELFELGDGDEALAFLHHDGAYTDPESAPRPDLILLDLKLPRVSGTELLRRLINDPELHDIPVVILSGSDDARDVRAAYEAGAVTYLVKPVHAEQLEIVISEVTNGIPTSFELGPWKEHP